MVDNQKVSAWKACRPWSLEDLQQRLKTYTIVKWFGKPSALSALECAKRGWACIANDTLKCEFCEVILAHAADIRVYEDQVKVDKEFEGRLVSDHAAGCPWSAQQCAPGLLHSVCEQNATAYQAVAARLHQLCLVKQLPNNCKEYAWTTRLQQAIVDLGAVLAQYKQYKQNNLGKTRTQRPLSSLKQHASQQPSLGVDIIVDELYRQLDHGLDTSHIARACVLSACGWTAIQAGSSHKPYIQQQNRAELQQQHSALTQHHEDRLWVNSIAQTPRDGADKEHGLHDRGGIDTNVALFACEVCGRRIRAKEGSEGKNGRTSEAEKEQAPLVAQSSQSLIMLPSTATPHQTIAGGRLTSQPTAALATNQPQLGVAGSACVTPPAALTTDAGRDTNRTTAGTGSVKRFGSHTKPAFGLRALAEEEDSGEDHASAHAPNGHVSTVVGESGQQGEVGGVQGVQKRKAEGQQGSDVGGNAEGQGGDRERVSTQSPALPPSGASGDERKKQRLLGAEVGQVEVQDGMDWQRSDSVVGVGAQDPGCQRTVWSGFNPVTSHQSWCPWRTGGVVGGGDGVNGAGVTVMVAGWESMYNMLKLTMSELVLQQDTQGRGRALDFSVIP